MMIRTRQTMFILVGCYAAGLVTATVALGAEPKGSLSNSNASSSRYTVKLTSGDNIYVGHPIVHNEQHTVLLRRNGRMNIFKAREVDKMERVSSSFKPKTGRQLRVELQKEFGSKYEVSLTNHYVVVHPPGDYKKWALPFEQFYVRFRQSLTAHGMSLKQPEFPMVAIVLLNRSEYDRFASKYTSFSFRTGGYYSSSSNRMITYDMAGNSKRSSSRASLATMSTVIHEATHQAAYNVGIQPRFYRQPKWFSEGFATMFEAPGINNPAENSKPKDRIEPESLHAAARFFDQLDKPGIVKTMVTSDVLFDKHATSAYGISWAMSSYLFEKFPRNYVRYVTLMNMDPANSSWSAEAKLKTFTDAFGSPERIEGGLRSYVAELAR